MDVHIRAKNELLLASKGERRAAGRVSFRDDEFYRSRSGERALNLSEPERISYEKEETAEKRDTERAEIAPVQTERTKTTGRGRRHGAPEHSRI